MPSDQRWRSASSTTGGPVDPVVGDRGPQRIAAHALQPRPIAPGHDDSCVEIEPVTGGVTRSAPRRPRLRLGPRATPPDLGPGPGPCCRATLDGGRREPGQHRRLRCEGIWLTLIGRHASPLQEPVHAPRNSREHVVHVVLTRRPRRMKLQSPRPLVREHPVEDESMRVHVRVERRPKPLNDRDRPAPTVRNPGGPRPTPEEPEHRGNQPIQPTAFTLEPGEATGEPPTREEATKLLVDESRQPRALPPGARRCAERFVVIAHDLIKDAVGRSARLVDAGGSHSRAGGADHATS